MSHRGQESSGPAHGSDERAIMRQLWQLYEEAVLPLEQAFFYKHFHAPAVTVEEFESRPQVLLVGQYSTGKTSMVRWLTEVNSSHFDVRPQPSTDKFMAVVHGEEEQLVQGNAATSLPQLPYQGLSSFGASFLNNFQALVIPSKILTNISFVDTPGVLAGNKQTIGRPYNYAEVCEWMADRADLVLLTFDAHKLDISDEFEEVMKKLKPYAKKVRCILNKADQVTANELIRVYGALQWNVGKVMDTPEVMKVFISSFWAEEAYRHQEHREIFETDKAALQKELTSLPKEALLGKIEEFLKRVRRVRTHICLLAHIRKKMPWYYRVVGADDHLRSWLGGGKLSQLFAEAKVEYKISDGDMLDLSVFSEKLRSFEDLSRIPIVRQEYLLHLDNVAFRLDKFLIQGSVAGYVTLLLRALRDAVSGDSRSFLYLLVLRASVPEQDEKVLSKITTCNSDQIQNSLSLDLPTFL